MAPDLSDLETCDPLELHTIWMGVCRYHQVLGSRQKRGRAYWIGFGSRPEIMRAGLIAYRDAASDAEREQALIGIVDQYDADCKAEAR